MVKTLVFDRERKASEIKEDFKLKRGYFYWTHLEKDDNTVNEITKILGKSKDFKEDLLEEQRPNLIKFRDFHVIVISLPSSRISTQSEKIIIQISFIITHKGIISISNESVSRINKLQDELLERKVRVTGSTTIFSKILDIMTENKIELLDELEREIEGLEKKIIINDYNKKVLNHLYTLKENLHYSSRMVKANLEVIKEILEGRTRFINIKYFSEHLEDRMLYLYDLHEYMKESINNTTNLLFSVQSQELNKRMYLLTIVGSLLIIPAIISGIFGMNVELPNLNFWQILGLITGFSILVGLIVQFIHKKI